MSNVDWIYLESSAALTWLLQQPGAEEVARFLRSGTPLVASDLLLLECERVLGRLTDEDRATRRPALHSLRDAVHRFPIDLSLSPDLGRPFPIEPVRTLDAIHLATALRRRDPGERVLFLALDRQIRENAEALGFECVPA